jgi:hypothetical protein
VQTQTELGSPNMHIHHLYRLDFLNFEMVQIEKAVKGYKEMCRVRVDHGDEHAWMERRQMDRLEQRIREALRDAHRSVNNLFEGPDWSLYKE